jgi:hypothetical protein
MAPIKCIFLGRLINSVTDCTFADEDVVKLYLGVKTLLKRN